MSRSERMDPAPDSALAASKRAGENAEHGIFESVAELEPVHEQAHYDAIAEQAIFPRQDLPAVGICVVEAGAPVEIKSTMAVYGETQRRGRFKLRQNQHDALVSARGSYIFAVCEPRPSRPIIAKKIVPARTIGHIVENVASWRDEHDGRGLKAQLNWSRLFTPSEVEP